MKVKGLSLNENIPDTNAQLEPLSTLDHAIKWEVESCIN